MSLDKNQDWNKLPKTYVIFITENDILGGDLPIYHIDRCIRELNYRSYGDESQIIYVNGAYRVKDGEARTALTSLIEDFHCVNPDDMNSQVLAARMRQIKNSEEEMSNMCRAMEEYAEEYAKKKDDERSEGIALDMMADNEPLDKILKYSRLAMDRIQELATKNGYTLINV